MTDAIVPSGGDAEPDERERTTLLVAYICYAVAAIGIAVAPVAGVVINHLKVDATRGSYLGSHHRWLLRTFWFSLLWFALAGLIAATIVLLPLAWLLGIGTAIWYVYRVVRGAVNFADRKPMPS